MALISCSTEVHSQVVRSQSHYVYCFKSELLLRELWVQEVCLKQHGHFPLMAGSVFGPETESLWRRVIYSVTTFRTARSRTPSTSSRRRMEIGAEPGLFHSATAREAFQYNGSWKPDVLVSDMGMPSEDGYELLKSLCACAGAWRTPN